MTAIRSGSGAERSVTQVWRGHGILVGTESTCRGDSGGPLYATFPDGSYTLVGVTSFGAQFECEHDGAGFVDLTQDGNLEWVKENLR